MSELRTVYEQILGGRLESRGFIRRMDELGVLEETGRPRQKATDQHACIGAAVMGRWPSWGTRARRALSRLPRTKRFRYRRSISN